MKCNECGRELPAFPEDAVEDGELYQVIGHKRNISSSTLFVSKKDYYCSPECFIEHFKHFKSDDKNNGEQDVVE